MWIFVDTQKRVCPTMSELYLKILEHRTNKTEKDGCQMKETYYFPHDYNARNDEKILGLLQDKGAAGYGHYWMIVEMLYEAGGVMRLNYERIAFALRTQYDEVKAVIHDFDLFEICEPGSDPGSDIEEKVVFANFTSKRVLANIDLKNRKSKKASESVGKRWNATRTQCEDNTNVIRTQCEGNTIKERKGKEIKGKDIKDTYSDCVLLSKDEFSKLTESFGIEGTNQRIKNLNDYVMSKGAKYKSHYHTILNWERKNEHGKVVPVFVNKAQVLMDQNIQAGKEAMAFLRTKYDESGNLRNPDSNNLIL